MSSTLKQNLTQAEELLRKKQYGAVLNLLQSIRIQDIEIEIDRSEYYYTFALYYYEIGQYQNALEKIEAALALSRKTGNHSLYANQKELRAWTCRELGKITDAIEAFTETYVSRKRAEEHDKIFASLVDLSSMHFLNGNLPAALSVLDEALFYARQYNGAREVGICERNKARLLIIHGDFAEANEILQAYYIDPNISPSVKAVASLLLGMLNVFRLDHSKASSFLSEALTLRERPNMERDRIVCLEYLGLNEYFAGNYDGAKENLLDILSRHEITASARAQTLRMLTDVYIAQDIFDQAEKKAAEAEEAIRTVNENIERGALYRSYGQICAHKNDSHQALEYFQKSIDLLHNCSARFELALTYLTCGRSKVYSVDERHKHLGKAREMFEEMAVPNWLKQVDEALIFLSEAAASKLKLPIVGRLALTPKRVYNFGWGLLAVSMVLCGVGFIHLKGTLTGFGITFASGILALETIVMMIVAKGSEKKSAIKR
jgi:tetratricopeptide (TPR) repeat protein